MGRNPYVTQTTGNGAPRPPTQRRRGWRLRPHGGIARLIRLLVAVPLIAAVGFGGLALAGSARGLATAADLRKLADLSAKAGAVARQVQAERVAAAVEIAVADGAARAAFPAQVARTDAAIAGFRGSRAATGDAQAAYWRIDSDLTALIAVREQVLATPRASLSSIAFSYRVVIADLLAFRESIAMGMTSRVAGDIRAADAVARAGEALGELQVVVVCTLSTGELTPAAQQESAADRARFAEASTAFLALARPAWTKQWEQVGAKAKVVMARRMNDELGRAVPGDRLLLDVTDWVQATDGWITELYGIQSLVDAAVADDAATTHRTALRDGSAQATGMLLVLAVTALLTGAVVRRIRRRLGALRDSAATVAYRRLPEVIRRMSAAPTSTADPGETADRSVAEFAVAGRDEIADVGRALHCLHREAVRIAGEQAVMRARIAEIAIQLSRREQRLIDAMLATVDLVEREETDPGRLRQLYQLDHLATRMARVNRSLLVLGGSGVSRVRRRPVTLMNVIQAAQSQIEHYVRVRIGPVEELAVAGNAVDEIVHLLAELLDNATTYSAPDKDVWVTGRVASGHAVVRVVDEGVGLSPRRRSQLNARLGNGEEGDLATVPSMGLTVVGRLAARHGVRVELRQGSPLGTTAEIVIPPAILRRETASCEPLHQLVGGDAATRRTVPLAAQRGAVPADASQNRTVSAEPQPARDLPGGVPRRRALPDTRPPGGEQPDKPDPGQVAAAMAAYAKGVAGYRPSFSLPRTGAQP